MNKSIISVSKREKLDCEEMAEYLRNSGIPCQIKSNVSIICKKGNCWREHGCQIISKEGVNKIWGLLQTKYDFGCAHLKKKYDGCVLKYLKKTDL
tara:strand:- start:152 stop:436 length:285 start_codon:yes stop_codon:yes gene_type:complete